MKIYLSHPIRGKKGKDATTLDMGTNCHKAIEIANYIKEHVTADIEIYVPGEHEDFVNTAYRKSYLTEKQILDVDCTIIDTCEVVMVYAPDDTIVGGCDVEIHHAAVTGQPVMVFETAEQAVDLLAEYLLRV